MITNLYLSLPSVFVSVCVCVCVLESVVLGLDSVYGDLFLSKVLGVR